MVTQLLSRTTITTPEGKAMTANHEEQTVQVIQMTEETLRRVIQESVQEFMSTMGCKWDDPTEMQKDFAALREWRETVQSVKRKSIAAVFIIIVTGIISFMVLGFKSSFHTGG